MLHTLLPQEKKPTGPEISGSQGFALPADSQRGTEIVLADHRIEAFSPAQEGTCGEVKGVKKKEEKRVFLFCQLCKG